MTSSRSPVLSPALWASPIIAATPLVPVLPDIVPPLL
jgi:hypothetical protein